MPTKSRTIRLKFRGQVCIVRDVCQFFLRLNAKWEFWSSLAAAVDSGKADRIRQAATALVENVFHRTKPRVTSVTSASVVLDGLPEVRLRFRRGNNDYIAELSLHGESINLMLSFWGFVVGFKDRGWLMFSVDGGPETAACAHLLHGATNYAVGKLRPEK
jgi:hypothetical protein